MNPLDLVIGIVEKEIKEEPDTCRQVILSMLSAWTKNPQNLRILAPSGEGKTYLVTKIARLFPQDRVIILQNATPQSFKYLGIKKVIETSPGKFEDYQTVMECLEGDEKKKFQDKTFDLVDLTNMVLVFVDAQSFQLWESLKSVLSHDQNTLKNFSVNKSRSGTLQSQRIVIRGHPAVIYCSAKDEQSLDQTDEINTRFITISLNSSQKKYREMLKLESIRKSVPDCIFKEEVISDSDIEKARQLIAGMIHNAEHFEVINPFAYPIQEKFSEDAGYRTRQLNTLLTNINLHTLANAKYRPKFTYNGTISVISTISDVFEANRLTRKPTSIQPAKLVFFNKYVRPAILENGKEIDILEGPIKCLTSSQIADYITSKGIATDRKRLNENYLRLFVDHGYIEEIQDPGSRNRYLYFLPQRYLAREAELESTFIDDFDDIDSRIKSFVDEIITRRFENGKLEDHAGNEIKIAQLYFFILNRRVLPQNTNEINSSNSSIFVDTRQGELEDVMSM